MSGNFQFSANNWLEFTPGSFVGTGAYTMGIIYQPAGANCKALCTMASAAEQHSFFQDTSLLYGQGDFSSGYGPTTALTWYVALISKPAGANHFRFALWPYASDGSGVMSHGESVGSGNHADIAGPLTMIRAGSALGVGANGLVSNFALWDRVLSDVEEDTLKSNKLQKWKDLTPKFLLPMNTWDGSLGTSVSDKAGTSTFSSKVGTILVGAEPPSFDYTLGGGTVTVAATTADNIRRMGIAQYGPGLSIMDYYNLSLADDIHKYGFGYAINKNFGGGIGAPTKNIKTHCAGTNVESMSDAAYRYYAAAATIP